MVDLTPLVSGAGRVIIIMLSVVIIGVIAFVGYLKYKDYKRYTDVCIILEKAGDNVVMDKDLGGVFIDNKTNNKRFFLKKHQVGLDPDNIPWVPGSKGQRYVYLLRVGLKNFRYLNMRIPADGKFIITVGEEDVNWALNAYEKYKKIFGSTLLQQLLPYIGIALMGVFILAMFVLLFNKIGILTEVAKAFEEAAKAFAQAKSGTTVIQ